MVEEAPAGGGAEAVLAEENRLVAIGQEVLARARRVTGFDTLGLRFDAWRRGWARVVFEASDAHHNPMGTLHGGFVAGLADTAMGMCYISTLEADESFTTLDLRLHFLRPVWSGRLVCEARVVHEGRTLGLVEADVRDEQGRVVAKAASTCMTLRGTAAQGR